jgi:hypothetical protein
MSHPSSPGSALSTLIVITSVPDERRDLNAEGPTTISNCGIWIAWRGAGTGGRVDTAAPGLLDPGQYRGDRALRGDAARELH